jgi:hypothetical protein
LQECIKIANTSRGFDTGRAVHHNESEAILEINVMVKLGGLEPPALQEIVLGMDQCHGVIFRLLNEDLHGDVRISDIKEPPCEMQMTHEQEDRNFTLPAHRARCSRAKEHQGWN